MLYLLLVSAFVCLLTLWVNRRGASCWVSAYIFFNALTLCLTQWFSVDDRDVPFTAMPIYAFEEVAKNRALIALIAFQLLALVAALVAKSRIEYGKVSSSRVIVQPGGGGVSFNPGERVFVVFGVIVSALSLLHLFFLDKGVLYCNYEYLLLHNSDQIGLDGLVGRVLHYSFRPLAVAASAVLPFTVVLRFYGASLLLAVVVTYAIVFSLAQNSRWAPLLFGVLSVSAFLVNGRNLRVLALGMISGVASGCSYFLVLIGRANVEQGLCGLGSTFEFAIDVVSVELIYGIFINFTTGGLNLANSFSLGGLEWPDKYKLLSFSPLFSAIDGFSAVSYEYAQRITYTAPLSALSEVVHFGNWYVLFYFFVIVVWLYQVERLSFDARFRLLCVSVALFIVMFVLSYPIRNSFRLILLATLAAYLVRLKMAVSNRADAFVEKRGV